MSLSSLYDRLRQSTSPPVRQWFKRQPWFVPLARKLFGLDVYSDSYYADIERLEKDSVEIIADWIVRHLEPRRVIDVGCGPGHLMAALHRRGVEVFGVDIAEAALRRVRAKGLSVAKFDLTQPGAALPGGPYDLAVCCEVAEHLEARYARALVSKLAQAAPRVFLTAAQPDDRCGVGLFHVNEQPHGYWIDLFAQTGLLLDQALTTGARDAFSSGVISYLTRPMIFVASDRSASSDSVPPPPAPADPAPIVPSGPTDVAPEATDPIQHYYERYWDQPEHYQDPTESLRQALICKHLSDLPAGTRVLDIGCGRGEFCAFFREQLDWDPIGIDLSSSVIGFAQRTYPHLRFLAGPTSRLLPAEEGRFDVVFSSEVIEHLFDVGEFFDQANRLLKPGGRLVLTTPYHGRVKNLIISLRNFSHHFDPLGQHIRFFDRAGLDRCLRLWGFEPTLWTGYGRRWPVWMSFFVIARKIKPSPGPLRVSTQGRLEA